MKKIIIAGNIGKDGAKVLKSNSAENPKSEFIVFSVAVNEPNDRVSWIECSKTYKNEAPVKFVEALKQGQAVCISGVPYAKSYIKEGEKAPTAILALFIDELTFL